MRIAYLSDERFPSTHTDTQQMAMTMEAMVGAGLDVHLVAPAFTSGPHRADQDAAMRAYYGVGDAFRAHFVRSADPDRRGLVKALHAPLAVGVARKLAPDVIYTRNAQIAVLALVAGFRVAFESYRVIDRRAPALAKSLGRLTRSARFLGVIVHSQVSADAFARIGVPRNKIRVVYNGFSLAQMSPERTRREARAELGLDEQRKLAVFAGHVMPKKGLESLADVAARTRDIDHVWVGGTADGSPAFGRSCATDAGARNVRVTGWLAAKDVTPYLYAADVLLIPPSSTPLAKHGNTVLPMKIFGYLAAGRAILAPALSDLQELLKDGENAKLTAPDDVPAYADALHELARDDRTCERLGDGARETVRDLTWEARALKIRDALEEWIALSR